MPFGDNRLLSGLQSVSQSADHPSCRVSSHKKKGSYFIVRLKTASTDGVDRPPSTISSFVDRGSRNGVLKMATGSGVDPSLPRLATRASTRWERQNDSRVFTADYRSDFVYRSFTPLRPAAERVGVWQHAALSARHASQSYDPSARPPPSGHRGGSTNRFSLSLSLFVLRARTSEALNLGGGVDLASAVF